MRKLIVLGLSLIVIGLTLTFKVPLFELYTNVFGKYNQVMKIDKKNANNFFIEEDYEYVQLTDSFVPKNRQDVLNIYYTIINSGISKFSFTCKDAYPDCDQDVDEISNSQVILSNINNYVHPYNSFKNIETQFAALDNISVKVTHAYTKDQIKAVENVIADFITSKITMEMSDEEKIRAWHDYVIDVSTYDSMRSNNNIIQYDSDIAYGNLIEGYGICGGYADSMKIFLDYFGIKNYKVSSENHIWNFVLLGDNWYHLDLTWDDPIPGPMQVETIDYTWFLITTAELEKLGTDSHHYYDKSVFKEAR